MANPKLEDGYIRIANELYQALFKVNLNGSELRIVHFILYQTYGYNKKIKKLSATYISDGTGIPLKTVRRCLKSLVEYNVLISRGADASAKMFGINKNYEKWVLKNGERVPKNGERVPKIEYGGYSNLGTKVLKNEYQYNTDKTIQNKHNVCLLSYSENEEKQTKPTLKEIELYCKSQKYSFDYKKFFDHYNAYGWKYKGKEITDWKSLADKWEQVERKNNPQYSSSTSYDIDELENYSMFDEER
nr:MAG TPA: replication protein O [Caudoviricetes sp.]